MRLIHKAYTIALDEMKKDWKEISGPGSNPNIKHVYSSVDGLGPINRLDDSTTSWCACMANYIIQLAGGRGTRSPLARSFIDWGRELLKPEIGCIAVLKRGAIAWQAHTGFVVWFNDNYIWLLAGNQSDDFCIRRFNRAEVISFRTSLD